MRLVQIAHFRCNEYSDTSYVSVLDGVSDDEVYSLCELAMKAALDAERESKKAAPQYPQEPSLQTLPRETTVGAALDHYQRIKSEYDSWQKKKNAASRTFEEFLYELSGGKVVSLYRATEDSKPIELSWGHNHGSAVRYGTERKWPDPE